MDVDPAVSSLPRIYVGGLSSDFTQLVLAGSLGIIGQRSEVCFKSMKDN